jgi:uncharacterized membrane protein YgaE (UPF0421/DUF939 family)
VQETVITGDSQSDDGRSKISYYRNLNPTTREEMIIKIIFEMVEDVNRASNEAHRNVPLLIRRRLIREDTQKIIDDLLQKITDDSIRRKAAKELKASFDSDNSVNMNISSLNSIPGRIYKN